ncbi:MAG: hypothetical protein FH761_17745 [Firmicutes bacterium]|nr:hypothetical protein [Bacillota bacterium]
MERKLSGGVISIVIGIINIFLLLIFTFIDKFAVFGNELRVTLAKFSNICFWLFIFLIPIGMFLSMLSLALKSRNNEHAQIGLAINGCLLVFLIKGLL